jgi:hypothetical protein
VDAAVTATAGPAPGSGEAFELHAGHRHPDIPGLTVVRLAAGLDLLRRTPDVVRRKRLEIFQSQGQSSAAREPSI